MTRESIAEQRRRSHWAWRGLAVLLFWLALFYYVSPIFGAARLAGVLRSGDPTLIADSIDFRSLRRSVARQVLTEADSAATGVQRSFAIQVGTRPVAVWLDRMLTIETISQLLTGKQPQVLEVSGKPVPPLPSLQVNGIADMAQLWWRSGFLTLGEYRLVVGDDGTETGLHFRPASFSLTRGFVWRLSGIELSKPLLDAAVRHWREVETDS
jgi:hypothetical protein